MADVEVLDGAPTDAAQRRTDTNMRDVQRSSVCGDGVIDQGESCDDGNQVTEACDYGQRECVVCGDECREQPGLPSYCGDGTLDEAEACDDGDDNGVSLCSSECQEITCGEALDYRIVQVGGWRVCVSGVLERDNPDLADRALRALDEDLAQIIDALPGHATSFLRRVFIWLELAEPAFPGGVYHPSAAWLMENGYPPAWAEGVQVGNAENYMNWVQQQPAMILHELAHAWHHQRLGYGHEPIREAYEAAMAAGLYDEVEYVSGGVVEAYATSNRMEYFAELTEAWYWSNDFYPFRRDELLEHDPQGAVMIREAWQSP